MSNSTQYDTTRFNEGMRLLVAGLELEAKTVVKKECGELLKTLIKLTPPAEPARTRESIATTIKGRFAAAKYDHAFESSHYNGKLGSTGILWYQVDSRFLRGIAPDRDYRDAGVEELKQLRWRITKKGRLNLPFKHPHKTQRVLLYQTILAKDSTIKKLIAHTQKNIGRLKAGWLGRSGDLWDFINPSGANMPPKYVMEHKRGSRGYFIDGLGVPGAPSMTIANYAKGVGNKRNNLDGIVHSAMQVRLKAMAANLALYLRGKKNVADYAKGVSA